MVAEIIETITAWVTGMISAVVEAIQGVVPIFYNATDSSLTFIGVLALMGLGIGIVSLGIGFVQRLIKR